MAWEIYKPGQGKWTRILTAAGVGALVLAGVSWVWSEMDGIRDDYLRSYLQTGMALVVVLGMGALVYWALNWPKIADFMIATEAEMRKVNWPSRREIVGSTVVVIGGMLMMAAMLWAVDILFTALFVEIKVIEGQGLLSRLFS